MAVDKVPDEFMILPTGGSREMGSHKGYSLAAMIDVRADRLVHDCTLHTPQLCWLQMDASYLSIVL